MIEIDSVVFNGGQNRITTFRLDLPSRTRRVIVIGSHLRQQPIAQSEWRKTEPAELESLDQFCIYRNPCDDDFRSAYADPRHLASLLQR